MTSKAESAAKPPPVDPSLAQKRYETLVTVGEECVTESDLLRLVSNKPAFRLYDGFEPSGRMHIAQGVFKALNVNKCTSSGGTFVFWVADWFALMNDKMGGDLEKIRVVGKYFVEVWKAAGMNMEVHQVTNQPRVEFRWASEDIINDADKYWSKMLDVAKRFTVARIMKCCQIMGRQEGNLTAAQILYPLMQCTDIFFLKADICQLGLDQRKVNMLARDYCDSKGIKNKPVILSQHMISGLKKGQAKMSKSDPDSAIFMEDKTEDIQRKIHGAYCPDFEKDENGEPVTNPCLDYIESICLNGVDDRFIAGGVEYTTIEDVKAAFYGGTLPQADLKETLANVLEAKIQPVRTHFEENDEARQLLTLVEQYKAEIAAKKALGDASVSHVGDKFQPDIKELKETCAKCSLIFFPVVNTIKLSASIVFNLLCCFKEVVAKHPAGNVVFYVPDLSAIAYNAYSQDKKTDCRAVIKAAYSMLIAVVSALLTADYFSASVLDTVKIRFVWQSELMLKDPSNYWINVIHIGRTFQLSTLLEALNYSVSDSNTPVGPVIGTLLHVADIVALNPVALYSPVNSPVSTKNELAITCFQETGLLQGGRDIQLVQVEEVSTKLLQGEHKDKKFMDDDLLVTDSAKTDIKRKIKRAFCEPGNTAFNPPLALASFLGIVMKTARDESKSGLVINEQKYVTKDALLKDVASEALHPKDLKDTVTKLTQDLFLKIEQALASDAVKKDLSTFQKYFKKMLKK